MRLKLTISQAKSNQLIPINYQYPLSAFIYHTIARSDNEYSKWLHRKGFTSGNKRFKLFTFSMLNIPKFKIENDRFRILCNDLELTVSMISEKAIEHFIKGVFENQNIKIYDRKTEAEFYISTVESLAEPEYNSVMRFRALSPIMLTRKVIHKGKESSYYMNPEDADYHEYFKRNIEEKYMSYCITLNEQVSEFRIYDFKLLSKPKLKLVTVKSGTKEETQVKGYIYEFEVKWDKEFLRIGYEAGFGKLCSLGFGCVSEVH